MLFAASCSTDEGGSTVRSAGPQAPVPGHAGDAPVDDDAKPAAAAPVEDAEPEPARVPLDASVLAFAVEASEGLSYSFKQGFAIDMSMMGIRMNASPEAPVSTGFVDGDKLYMHADLSEFFADMMQSFGVSLDDPAYAGMADAFAQAEFEAWVDGDTMVLDMSRFVSALDDLSPGSMGALGELAEGPVSIDLSTLVDVNAGTLVSDLGGQGTDPSQILESLLAVEAVFETGSSTVGGVEVTVYEGSLSMEQFIESQGADLGEQMSQFGDLGTMATDPDVLAALDSMVVDVEVMVDADGLVRRIAFDIDMSEMFSGMGSDAATGEDFAGFDALFADAHMSFQIWQEYGDYGESFVLDLPDAVDVTSEFDSLYGQLALM